MDCNETRRLLDADSDGELDLVRHLEIEAHLRACPACAERAAAIRARRAALRESLPRFTAPPHLAAKIRAALPSAAAPVAVSAVPVATVSPAASAVPTGLATAPAASAAPSVFAAPVAPSAPVAMVSPAAASVSAAPAAPTAPAAAPRAERAAKIIFPLWQFAGLAASLTLAGLVGYTWGHARAHAGLVVDEAVADHIRSLQASHLNDVASTDQHTVKPWFAGRLDFSPPVADLAAAGFPLTGGRLEHLDGHPAAALVFHRRQHAINLFIWPAGPTALSTARAARQGYATETWTQAGFNFLAVSEIPAAELAAFAQAFRASQTPAVSP